MYLPAEKAVLESIILDGVRSKFLGGGGGRGGGWGRG